MFIVLVTLSGFTQRLLMSGKLVRTGCIRREKLEHLLKQVIVFANVFLQGIRTGFAFRTIRASLPLRQVCEEGNDIPKSWVKSSLRPRLINVRLDPGFIGNRF